MNKMNLGNKAATQTGSSRIQDFSIGADRLEVLERKIQAVLVSEFWSPKTQAWLPLINAYLQSGNRPDWARKYSGPLFEREDWLTIPENEYTQIYKDIRNLKNTSGTEVFDGVYFNTIRKFCETTCKFYISQRKRIIREVHSPGVYNDVMTKLMGKETYRSLMLAVLLYRRRYDRDHQFDPALIEQMRTRLASWTEAFVAEFKEVQKFLGDLVQRYSWYSDTVRDALERVWSIALEIHNPPAAIEPRVARTLSDEREGALRFYISNSPAGDGPDVTGAGVFNAMQQIFFSNVQPEDSAECAVFALCVPPATFKGMVDYLYDFYWMVEDGILTGALYSRIVVAHQRNKDIDPDEYLESLAYRGYPPLE